MFLHLDCRHYLGDRPCRFARLCEGCPHYEPMGPRVLIIKLSALGDVVRTGCLLPGLAKRDEPPYVTWLTSPASVQLVKRMPGVHRVLAFDVPTLLHLDQEFFDVVFSLDKEPAPAAAAMRVNAAQRMGIGLSRYGTVFPLNDECNEYFLLGLDDRTKFHCNEKSYPRLIYEALGMRYDGEEYRLETTAADRAAAAAILERIGAPAGGLLIGLNPGAGHVFANKAWRPDGYVRLIADLSNRLSGIGFLMLGGPDETDLIEGIMRESPGQRIYHPGTSNDLGTFAALIERCAVVVSGDTLAMHLALAVGSRSVAIFGPTCEQEIDMFGRGEKVVTPIECSPCYKRTCDIFPSCQDRIPAQTVLEAVMRQLDAVGARKPRTTPVVTLNP